MHGVQDIRISIGLFTNLKVQHLRKKLGADGVLSLIQLWCYAGMHRADGMLTGMRPACVELAAGWTGACGSLCDTLLDLGLLDLNKDTFYIHDWSENQPWAANKQKRTDSAKLAAAERWKSKNAGRMRTACGPQSNRNAPSPIPIPIPIPKHTETGAVKDSDLMAIYELYPRKVAKPAALKAIKKSLEKTDVETLKRAVSSFATTCIGKDPQYIPHPATWFNQERWADQQQKFEPRDEREINLPITKVSLATAIWMEGGNDDNGTDGETIDLERDYREVVGADHNEPAVGVDGDVGQDGGDVSGDPREDVGHEEP